MHRLRGRRGLLALVTVAACARVVPHIDGAPAAPSAPDRVWIAPRAARIPDSGIARPIPSDLLARATSLSLADVVDVALRNNPATRVSWAQARAAAQGYGVARANYFPAVNAVVAGVRTEQPGGETGGSSGTGSGVVGPRTSLAPSVSLSYLLLDFGGRSGAVESARETAFAMSYAHNQVVQTTVLQVEQAYFAYVGTRALRDAQHVSLLEAQASYDAARARDSVGLATVADVLQAKTAVAQSQLQLQTTEAQLEGARSSLALALGVPPTAAYDVAAAPEDVPVGEVTASVEELIDAALGERPDLQAARANAAAARAAVREARGATRPSLSLAAGDGYTRSSLGPLSGRNYSLSLSLQIPLFDGGARGNDVGRAQSLADVAAAQVDAQRQTVIADVYTSFYNLRTATQQVHTTDDLLTSATASMRAARARYTAGVASILDLLTAQAALATARAEQAQSRWVWAQALAQLGFAAGALDRQGRAAVPVAPDSARRVLP